MTGAWGIVQTKVNSESRAALNLQRVGFLVYFPRVIYRRYSRQVVRSLFPRYVFVYVENQWEVIRSTFGVSCILASTEGKPATVGWNEIKRIVDREDEDGLIRVGPILEEPCEFEEGQVVKVIPVGGLLDDYIGKFLSLKNRERAYVSFEMIGLWSKVEIDRSLLVAC